MLYIKINKLNINVKNQDYFSKNDLFITLTYGNNIRNTTIKWNQDKPVWNEAFCFDYINRQVLIVDLYHANKWSSNKKLYTCKFIPKYGNLVKENVTIFSITMGDINKCFKDKVNELTQNLNNKSNEIKSIKNKLDDKINNNNLLKEQLEIKENDNKSLKEIIKSTSTDNNKLIDKINNIKKLLD